MRITDAMQAAMDELVRATEKHGPMVSAHEGKSVIEEEFDELWDEIKKQNPDPDNLKKEATHLAAMALRFLVDLC